MVIQPSSSCDENERPTKRHRLCGKEEEEEEEEDSEEGGKMEKEEEEEDKYHPPVLPPAPPIHSLRISVKRRTQKGRPSLFVPRIGDDNECVPSRFLFNMDMYDDDDDNGAKLCEKIASLEKGQTDFPILKAVSSFLNKHLLNDTMRQVTLTADQIGFQVNHPRTHSFIVGNNIRVVCAICSQNVGGSSSSSSSSSSTDIFQENFNHYYHQRRGRRRSRSHSHDLHPDRPVNDGPPLRPQNRIPYQARVFVGSTSRR